MKGKSFVHGHAQMVTPSATPLVSLDDIKMHLRVDHNAEDNYLLGLVAAAVQWCEQLTRRCFLSSTYVLHLDDFPSSLRLNRGAHYSISRREIRILPSPLLSVESITYLADADTRETLATDRYDVIADAHVPLVLPVYDGSWPDAIVHPSSVQIAFTAGYGASPSDVPWPIIQAVMMLAGHLYENREATAPIQIHSVPYAVEALLAPYVHTDYR